MASPGPKYLLTHSVPILLLICLFRQGYSLSRSSAQRIPTRNKQKQRREFLSGLSMSSLGLLFFSKSVAWSLSPEEASTAYDSYAANYDSLDGGKGASVLGIDEARSDLFRQACGNVLEIGAGTGLNLERYDTRKLKSLTLLDISDGMLSQAKNRLSLLGDRFNNVDIKFVKADATSDLVSIFGLASFDTVVDSFSLCTMGNDGAKKCLDQIRQVVKYKNDGGQILLLENSRSSNPLLGIYQDATATSAAGLGGKGCVYNQNVEDMIQSTGGMKIDQENLYAAGLFRSFQCSVLG